MDLNAMVEVNFAKVEVNFQMVTVTLDSAIIFFSF